MSPAKRGPLGLAVVGLFAALVLALAGFADGGSESRTLAGESFAVGFHFTYVSTVRAPTLVEARIAGKGTLNFKQAPDEGHFTGADSVGPNSRVVVELDYFAPHRKTYELALDVVDGNYLEATQAGKLDREVSQLLVEVGKATLPGCASGDRGVVVITRRAGLSLNRIGLRV
jgi:hypothetical protein